MSVVRGAGASVEITIKLTFDNVRPEQLVKILSSVVEQLGYGSVALQVGQPREGRLILFSPCGEAGSVSFNFGDGELRPFTDVKCYDVEYQGERIRILVGRGVLPQPRFNRREPWVVLFRAKSGSFKPVEALSEFLPADSYEADRKIVTRIRKPDGSFMRIGEVDMFPEYRRIKQYIVPHEEAISSSPFRGHAALVVREDDVEVMLYHAAVQYVWKRMRKEQRQRQG